MWATLKRLKSHTLSLIAAATIDMPDKCDKYRSVLIPFRTFERPQSDPKPAESMNWRGVAHLHID